MEALSFDATTNTKSTKPQQKCNAPDPPRNKRFMRYLEKNCPNIYGIIYAMERRKELLSSLDVTIEKMRNRS